MCRFPINIKNRSRSFVDACSPVLFRVPCGHCSECLKQMRDDWFVRAFFEYYECKKNGGVVYLILLTYDDEHLPFYEDKHFQMWKKFGYKIPCFSPADLKSFRDKFRVYVSRKYGAAAARGIRFFFASEYGKKTGRPHYHVVCYIPFAHRSYDLLGTVKGKYTDGLFAKAWSCGYVGVSTKYQRAEINSPNGISYVMKYIQKRCPWSKSYYLDKYLSYIHEQADLEDEPGKYTEMLHDFRRSLPRHYQSKGFGSCAVKYFLDLNGEPLYSKFTEQISLAPFGYIAKYNYKVPRYYYNKLFYDFDKVNEVRYLNDFGKNMKKVEFDRIINNCYEGYNKYFNYNNFVALSKLVPLDVSLNFLSYRNMKTFKELYHAIFNITLDRPKFNLRLFTLYSKVYRHINIKDYAFLNDYSYYQQMSFVYDNAYDIYLSRFDFNPYRVYPSGFQPALTDVNFTIISDFSRLSVFDDYDKSLMYLEDFIALINDYRERNDLEQDTINENLKEMYNNNSFIYSKLYL